MARRLPSIESLRELNQGNGIIEEDTDETPGEPTNSQQADARRTRRSSRISLPPSTVELLDRLDRSSQNAEAADAPVIESPLTEAPEFGTASTTTEQSTGSVTTQRERRARRTSIRNFTNRLSGWLGVGPSRTEETRGDHSPIASESAQPGDQETADRATLDDMTAAAADQAPAPTPRLSTGAVMIVQGFVQTTIPVRERRRRIRSQAGPSDAPPTRDVTSSQTEAPDTGEAYVDRVPAGDSNSQAGSADVQNTAGQAASLAGGIDNAEPGTTTATYSGSVTQSTGERPMTQESSSSTSQSQNSIRSSLRSATHTQAQEPSHQPDSAASARLAGSENRPEPPSFAEQARMLGGLLRQVIRHRERQKGRNTDFRTLNIALPQRLPRLLYSVMAIQLAVRTTPEPIPSYLKTGLADHERH